MEQTVTTNEILEAINKFADSTENRFNNIEGRLDNIEGRLDNVEGRLDNIDGRLNKAEALMVTKDYLDDKLGDLKGDIIVTMRKEDAKVKKLIEVLLNKKMLSEDEAKAILSMEPFPQLFT